MDTTWLTPVTDAAGPLASVHLDVTRTGAPGAREVELRWDAVEEQLRADGAPDAVLLRALVAQRGAVQLVEVAAVLPGGIGALLRFAARPEPPGSSA